MGYDSFPESAEVPQQWSWWKTVEDGDMIAISKSWWTKPVSVAYGFYAIGNL